MFYLKTDTGWVLCWGSLSPEQTRPFLKLYTGADQLPERLEVAESHRDILRFPSPRELHQDCPA